MRLHILALVLCCMVVAGAAQEWVQTAAPSNNWSGVACSADGGTIVGIASDGIYYSTNSGTAWWLNNTQMVAVTVSADGRKWAAVGGGTYIYLSTNYGGTWTAINAPTQAIYYDFTLKSIAGSADGKTLIVGPSVYTSTDSGITWTSQPVNGDSVAVSADGRKLFGVRGYAKFPGLYVSADSGSTWSTNDAPLSLFNDTLAISADGTKLTLFSRDVGISISTNRGNSWSTTTNIMPVGLLSRAASSADGSTLIGADISLYLSIDSGATWTTNDTPDGAGKRKCVASSADGNKLIAAVYRGGIWILQTTPATVLNISPSAESMKLSWTVPSRQFALEKAPDFTGTNWTVVTSSPVLNWTNLQKEVSIPRTDASGFYRLASP